MASSREYLEFILGQLSGLEEITHRAMMGEYILYYRGRVIGGIYDDRLLVKPVPAAVSRMPEGLCVSCRMRAQGRCCSSGTWTTGSF